VTDSTDLRIGGLTRLSSCDWPGELAATVFVQGCPWRCRYCHNAHLIETGQGDGPSWAEVMTFLATRTGLLDGVVFSGGEPTAQRALGRAMAEVRALGFKVGLHTGGPNPGALASVLPLVDWVGFDVKAPWGEYEPITGVSGSGEHARQSLKLLTDSGVRYEIRTTVHPALAGERQLLGIREQLVAMGADGGWVIQPFRATGCADDVLTAYGDVTVSLPESLSSSKVRG